MNMKKSTYTFPLIIAVIFIVNACTKEGKCFEVLKVVPKKGPTE